MREYRMDREGIDMGRLIELLRGRTKVVISAKEVEAARVIYESENVQTTEARISLPDGELLVLELTPALTRKLAVELVTSYRAMGYELRL